MVVGWFKKLKTSLSKSSDKISGGIKKILKSKKIDESTLQELEELMISSDLGVESSSKIIQELKKSKLLNPSSEKVKEIIKKKLKETLAPLEKQIDLTKNLFVILVVGVNGVGKPATIGKLAYKSVMTAKEKKLDILLIDTAGRLHNKTDLMNELSKIIRVIKKIDESIPSETILILDGNIGQNSIRQAEVFKEICDIDSLIVTKLDGSAKGGALIPIAEKLKIPISFIGTGESKEDLAQFDADQEIFHKYEGLLSDITSIFPSRSISKSLILPILLSSFIIISWSIILGPSKTNLANNLVLVALTIKFSFHS